MFRKFLYHLLLILLATIFVFTGYYFYNNYLPDSDLSKINNAIDNVRWEIVSRYKDGEKKVVVKYKNDGKNELILEKMKFGFTRKYPDLSFHGPDEFYHYSDNFEQGERQVYFHDKLSEHYFYNDKAEDNSLNKIVQYDWDGTIKQKFLLSKERVIEYKDYEKETLVFQQNWYYSHNGDVIKYEIHEQDEEEGWILTKKKEFEYDENGNRKTKKAN